MSEFSAKKELFREGRFSNNSISNLKEFGKIISLQFVTVHQELAHDLYSELIDEIGLTKITSIAQ